MSRNKDKHQTQEQAVPPEAGRAAKAAGGAPAAAAAVPAPAPAPAEPAPDLTGEQAATIAKLQDQLLRLRADFDNFRKRTLREKTELYDQAAADLMLELLPVLDHLQLGIQAAVDHKADRAIQEGLQLIFDQLMGVLMKFGLTPFDTEKQPFDPARCDAISRMASDTEPEGMVLAQTRRGYMLRNKLLRPAQVVVSSGAAGREPAAGQGAGVSPSEFPMP